MIVKWFATKSAAGRFVQGFPDARELSGLAPLGVVARYGRLEVDNPDYLDRDSRDARRAIPKWA